MRTVFAFYLLSGFVSLVYQVVWFYVFVDRFGSTNLTFVLVVCTFIGGLSIGALASRRVQRFIERRTALANPLRTYGLVELLVSAAMLITIFTGWFALAGDASAYVLGDDGMYRLSMSHQLGRIVIASLCVFVPCFFMGVTFPPLCSVFHVDQRFPAALYAWNTLGACSGVLASEYLFLPALGYEQTLWLMIGLNVLIGMYFIVRGGAPTETQEKSPINAVATEEFAAGEGMTVSFLLIAATLSGFLSGALEGDLFKRLWFLGCDSRLAMSFISFWAILAIFLASATVRLCRWITLAHIRTACAIAVGLLLLTWTVAVPLRDWMSGQVAQRAQDVLGDGASQGPSYVAALPFLNGLSEVLFFTGIFVFPSYFLIALLLPWICNRIHSRDGHLGLAYGLNTAAFCLGMVAFTWLAPAVNIFYSLRLWMIVFALLVALLFVLRETQRVRPWKLAAAGGLILLAAALTPRSFAPSYFSSNDAASRHEVTALKSNAAHTTYVVHDPAGKRLYFDGHSMSGTSPAIQRYMRLMAHVPLLAHPDPQKALLICFGVGNTASAIAAHDTIKDIAIVDLNHKVFETAPEFADTNQNVLADPRVRLIHDDGRNFLNLTDEKFDLVTSEPPPPMQEGVVRLYSLEYYQSVRAHLTQRGMMTQWLPIWQMPPEAVARGIATFIAAFPHAAAFSGAGQEIILLGSNSPIDFALLEQRFRAGRAVTADLSAIGITSPVSLLARFIACDEPLREAYQSNRVISDQRNDLSGLFRDPLHPATIAYEPARLLADMNAAALAHGESLASLLADPNRLFGAVPDFPFAGINVDPDAGWSARQATAASGSLTALNSQAIAAERNQDFENAFRSYQRSLQINPHQPEILFRIGVMAMRGQMTDEALKWLEHYRGLELADGRAEWALGTALLQARRFDEAAPVLRRAIELNPYNVVSHITLGDALRELGRRHEAAAAYAEALRLDPSDALAQRRAASMKSAAEAPAAGPAIVPGPQ